MSNFLFAVCQTGAEPALKKEIARDYPEFRFAYSRQGFVTFKRADGATLALDVELRAVFARAYGISLGSVKTDAGKVVEWAKEQSASHPGKVLRLHLWERDQFLPGDEPLGFELGLWESKAREAIQRAAPAGLFASDPVAERGDLVLDVIALSEEEWWVGVHLHTPTHSPFPGGRPPAVLPEEAPSRAYLKLEQGLLWSGAPLRKGDLAVEIGSAPGGASYLLLKRGVHVIGVDPGEMDPRVLTFSEGGTRFLHLQKSAMALEKREIPAGVHWLLLDMNASPSIALHPIETLSKWTKDSLLGVILTLKLNQWSYADHIPKMIEMIKKMGMVKVRATQLAGNRQEIFVYGLTKKGTARAGSSA